MAAAANRTRVYVKRLSHDVKNLSKEGVEYTLDDEDKNGAVIRAWVVGPDDTPYAGYKFEVQLLLVHEWPFKSPSVAFLSKVLHPNVEWASGAICCNQLNEEYTSATRLATIIKIILPQLLSYPNADDPFNVEAARLLMSDADAYGQKVRDAVTKHGTPVKV